MPTATWVPVGTGPVAYKHEEAGPDAYSLEDACRYHAGAVSGRLLTQRNDLDDDIHAGVWQAKCNKTKTYV